MSVSVRRARGFTLIELMVVIVILGLLVGLVAPNIWRVQKSASIDAATSQMAMLGESITLFRLERRALPRSLDELTQEDAKTREPFLKSLPDDPWGQPYVYRVLDAGKGAYELASSGEDETQGTDDDLHHPKRVAAR